VEMDLHTDFKTRFRKLDLKALEIVCELLLQVTDLHLRRYCRLLQQCILEPIIHRQFVGLKLPADEVGSDRPIMDAMERKVPKTLLVKLRYPKGRVFVQKPQTPTPQSRFKRATPFLTPIRPSASQMIDQ
jgi:hypothetical protein